MKASYQQYGLQFKRPSGTSRGILTTKETWFILLDNGSRWGLGECGLLRGLSVDDLPHYEAKLSWVCENIGLGLPELYAQLMEFPSIQMGLEMAFRSLEADNPFHLFPSAFTLGTQPISINGLIWMGAVFFMKEQIREKLDAGFRCLKMKIGALDFDTEYALLQTIRKEYSSKDLELRVDANGAFSPSEAMEKLKRLSELELHSIEQPIKAGQWDTMASLCERTPLPIALDEELIGVFDGRTKARLLQHIQPQYLILKPSFVGGFQGSDEWIQLAEKQGTGWWVTSALESNVGLNAISQYTFTKSSKLPQGLGTGSLFANNVPSPLEVRGQHLWYNPDLQWDVTNLF
ncbi:MAG TPA: o-succinylbenzoate synthase [Flavobacteriaceae bacterium]|nr:o-succinylbenzoate synthase [Flavobacteriaceae bacterium]MCB9212618.1 o-succinylbenzoate synthase [Alteromonas sp.]HPF10687.1 o-succinylbenzoate synthase [Flavobacteriaceae bacterium]HQU21968.1 o-succinylbenzoate synthase [Flavobacteriaceae bacterium]HQU64322.1 o-succinylbenzoate synthase [Flavobacteriaceae bacterium]